MKRSIAKGLAAATLAVALGSCATGGGKTSFITLIDGDKGLENFNRVGDADWTTADGAISAAPGGKNAGYLVSKNSYGDFFMRVEFWASDDANSGVFLRCKSASEITFQNCYEANIFDQRPDPTYGTGGIVEVAPVKAPMPLAGGRWNIYEITLRGPHLILVLNGQRTVDVQDSKPVHGPFALQWVQGTIKFRKIELKPL